MINQPVTDEEIDVMRERMQALENPQVGFVGIGFAAKLLARHDEQAERIAKLEEVCHAILDWDEEPSDNPCWEMLRKVIAKAREAVNHPAPPDVT